MSGAAAGASDEPAFVLHSHAWSESSLIVEAFTRTRGRVALVARGAKKPGSNFRPVLLPLQLLRLGWRVPARRATENAPEIHALKSAEWAGGHVLPEGNALLGGLYCNELLLRLLARDDPHPRLFDHYAQAVRCLARPGRSGTEVATALRSFELLLLRALGYLPALERQSASGKTLVPDAPYSLNPEQGLAPGGTPGASLPGADWLALEPALAQGFAATLHATSQGTRAAALQPQLRALLQYHCGAPLLRTRQLMQQLQDLWKP